MVLEEPVDARAVEKALRRARELEYSQRFLTKDRSSESAVIEQVFDKSTLFSLYELMNEGHLQALYGAVSTGKEARVYWGVTAQGASVAVKIFATVAVEFRRRIQYVAGDPRFTRVPRSMKRLVELWAKKEFRNLGQAAAARVPVPQPLTVRKNVLIMEFIGEDGLPAPLLANVKALDQKDYNALLKHVATLYNVAGLVHADLSEYNVFKRGEGLILFDFGSAVDMEHPAAEGFLTRDLLNLNRFFEKRGLKVDSLDNLLQRVKGETR